MFAGHSTKNMSAGEVVSAIVNGELSNVIQAARVAKTKMFFEDRDVFLNQLVKEIRSAIKSAEQKGLTPVFRLNGTSDVRWENIAIGDKRNIMEVFPDVQFYDYTKHANRRNIPANYHLTFSLAESNRAKAISSGLNVAVVFRKTLPAIYTLTDGTDSITLPVVNGDETDLRFLDGHRVIVGLKAKGNGKKDTSGFVVDA